MESDVSDSFAVAFNHLALVTSELGGEVEYLFLVAAKGFVNIEKENGDNYNKGIYFLPQTLVCLAQFISIK